ncbi:MAG: PD40 domain-containing protein [Anaerolineae bacterium]|nr:PD40 domain-containing protein [Anaerolineae bacterium]
MRLWLGVIALFLAMTLLGLLAFGLGRLLPRGDQLLMEGERIRIGTRDLLLADVPHGLIVNLTRTPGVHEEHAAWSPDGTRFAFIRQAMEAAEPRQVCIRHPYDSIETCLPGVASWDDSPRWSPDGASLLLVSLDPNYGSELYHLPLDGGSVEPLTRAAGNDDQAVWSPDGGRIVFMSLREGLRRIYLMDSDGGDLRALTSPDSNASNPTWSPDGRWIAYVTDRDIGEEIYLIDVNCLDDLDCDGASSRLTHMQSLASDLQWSPDSQWLAFASLASGDFEVYAMAPDSGALQRWTHDPATDEVPAWSPAGDKIAFVSSREGPYNVYIQTGPDAPATRLTDGSMNYWTPLWRPGPAH